MAFWTISPPIRRRSERMSPGFDHCDCISESGEFEDMIAERVDLRIPHDDFKAKKFARVAGVRETSNLMDSTSRRAIRTGVDPGQPTALSHILTKSEVSPNSNYTMINNGKTPAAKY